jgi:hypothetical protein
MARLNTATQLFDLRNAHSYAHHQDQHHHQQQQAMDTMMRGLVEADHDVAELERRQRARQRTHAAGTAVHTATAGSSQHHVRSSSRGSSSHHAHTHSYSHTQPETPLASHTAPLQAPATTATAASHATHRERHHSPTAMRVHHSTSPSTTAGASAAPTAQSHRYIHLAAGTASTARETSRYAEHSSTHAHEQRLTKEFLTSKTSPSASPAAAAPTAQAAQHHAAAPVTHAHANVSTTGHAAAPPGLLSTSAMSHAPSTRMRSAAGTHRDTSFQLPVTSMGSGTGALRVSRSSTPVSAALAGSTPAASALGASRRVARGTTDAR